MSSLIGNVYNLELHKYNYPMANVNMPTERSYMASYLMTIVAFSLFFIISKIFSVELDLDL